MSGVTPNLNLSKPTTVQQFSLALINSNYDKIDAANVSITRQNSTHNDGDTDFTGSIFTRIRSGSVGIIVAQFRGVLKTGYTFNCPSNTSALALFNVAIIPTSMRPLNNSTQMNGGGVISGSGRGDNLHCAISTNQLAVRSAGAAFSAVGDGAIALQWAVVYAWNGVV